MQATGDARFLQPIVERFRDDGAPSLPLSPSKSLKNASIIYDAIKSLPDKTLLRGDFDRLGKPWIYFPERDKKRIGKLSSPSLIRARNIDIDRQDIANFLASIADAALKMPSPDQRSLCAAALLKKVIAEVGTQKRDFNASDIRAPLRTLTLAYKRTERQRVINAYQQLCKRASRLQCQRFERFCAIPYTTFTQLGAALKPASASRYEVDSSLAVYEMKQFLNAYRRASSSRSLRFGDYLRFAAISDRVHYFAQRWIAISQPDHTKQRMQFDTESWAREMDNICPLIIKAYHRQARVDGTPGTPGAPGQSRPRLIHQRPSSLPLPALPELPALPPLPAPPALHTAVPRSTISPASVPASSAAMASTPAPAQTLATASIAVPSGLLHVAAKMPPTPAVSINASMHKTSEADLKQSEVSDSFGLGNSTIMTPETDGTESEGARSSSVQTRAVGGSDSLLIAEVQSLLGSPLPTVLPVPTAAYRPIGVIKPDEDFDIPVHAGLMNAQGLMMSPKQPVDTPSMMSSLTSTEIDPPSESLSSLASRTLTAQGTSLASSSDPSTELSSEDGGGDFSERDQRS